MSSKRATDLTPEEQRIRVLSVDDDAVTRAIIRKTLDKAGIEAWFAASGPEALDLLSKRGVPHLALVDIKMPGMSGPQLCRKILEYLDLPVVMVTSVGDKQTVIRVLEKFAEDYITKPFEPDELIARVRCLMRRLGEFSYRLEPRIRVDDRLQVELAQRTAIVEDRYVELTPIETKLLYILMRNAGRTTFTDFLLRRMWPDGEIFEDTLRTHVHRLRKKIEISPRRPRYVLTKRGLGYWFPAKEHLARMAHPS